MKWVLSYCGAKSARIHSHYVRTFQDLPIQHMKTIVVLNNRKLFCDNQDCAYRTFAEPFGFIKPKFKKTDRLIEEIINQISEVLRIGNKSVMTYCKIPLEEKAKYDTVLLVKKSKAMENQELKATTIQLIQDMIADGYSHIKISETIGKSERTVRRYLKADPSGRHGRTGLKQKQKLDPYKDEVLALSAKGQSSPKILCSIRNSEYTGSASSLREFLHKYSIEAAAERNRSHLTLCRIERPSLIALLYKDISKVKEISDDHYLRIIGLFPELGAVLQLLKTFKSVLMAGKPNELDAWIEAAKSLDIPELNSFLTGVRRDLEAIKNVILFPYSNGLA